MPEIIWECRPCGWWMVWTPELWETDCPICHRAATKLAIRDNDGVDLLVE